MGPVSMSEVPFVSVRQCSTLEGLLLPVTFDEFLKHCGVFFILLHNKQRKPKM